MKKQTQKRRKIASKKAWAVIKIALTVAFISDLNAVIEYAKAIPPQVWTFQNTAQAREFEPQQGDAPENEAKTTPSTTEQHQSEIQAEFSAYTADPGETDADPRTMASGKEVYEGAIACPDRYIIKEGKRIFGTKIEVDGLGTFTCEDRMAPRYRDKENFDIYFETKAEAFAFGRRTLSYRLTENDDLLQ